MQVVSGGIGREKVHYEAPNSDKLSDEMNQFMDWFNEVDKLEAIIKAAIAHLWFVTIHPFDDGNGRIARAITDMQLSKADGVNQRFYSMSTEINKQKMAIRDKISATMLTIPHMICCTIVNSDVITNN